MPCRVLSADLLHKIGCLDQLLGVLRAGAAASLPMTAHLLAAVLADAHQSRPHSDGRDHDRNMTVRPGSPGSANWHVREECYVARAGPG